MASAMRSWAATVGAVVAKILWRVELERHPQSRFDDGTNRAAGSFQQPFTGTR
jgi:hypothetical protein